MDRRLSRLKRECDGDRDVSDGSDTKTERELRDELMEGILAMFDTLQSMPLVTNTPPTEQQAVSCTEQGVNYTEPAVNHAEQDVNHAEHNHIEQDVDQTTPSSPSHTRSSSVSSSSISDTPTTPFNTIANASSETPTTTTTTAISSSPKDAPLVPLSPSSPAPPLIPTILLHSLPPLLGLDMGLDAYNKALVYFTRVVEAFNNFIFSMILLLVFSLALEILLYQQQQQHDPDGLSDSMSIYNSVQLKDDTQSFGLIQFLRYLAGNLVWRKEDFIPT
ncbi:hypothetical protein BGX33_003528 [Mortierella sp. NVP41]|nr:hypothetical protein BGX33_003528 [Mortierella sp. NVP41]